MEKDREAANYLIRCVIGVRKKVVGSAACKVVSCRQSSYGIMHKLPRTSVDLYNGLNVAIERSFQREKHCVCFCGRWTTFASAVCFFLAWEEENSFEGK